MTFYGRIRILEPDPENLTGSGSNKKGPDPTGSGSATLIITQRITVLLYNKLKKEEEKIITFER